jgi:hypothetical protein
MMTPDEVNAVSRWQLSVFEKVVGGVVVALLGWQAFTTQTMSVQVAVIEAKLTSATEDRYTGADALRDHALRDQKIGALEQRVIKIEGNGK